MGDEPDDARGEGLAGHVRAERPPGLRRQPVVYAGNRSVGLPGAAAGAAGGLELAGWSWRGGVLPQRLGGDGGERVGPGAVGGGAAGRVGLLRVDPAGGGGAGRRVPLRALRSGGVFDGARGVGVRAVRRGGLLDGAGVCAVPRSA